MVSVYTSVILHGGDFIMKKRIALPGSNRRPLPRAKVVGAVDSNQRLEIAIQIGRRAGSDLEATVNNIASQRLAECMYLTRAELASHAGRDPADMAKINSFAHDHRLTVVEADVAGRSGVPGMIPRHIQPR
jgi:kumamolisin